MERLFLLERIAVIGLYIILIKNSLLERTILRKIYLLGLYLNLILFLMRLYFYIRG